MLYGNFNVKFIEAGVLNVNEFRYKMKQIYFVIVFSLLIIEYFGKFGE